MTDFRKGDLVKLTRTLRVHNTDGEGNLYGRDEKSGIRFEVLKGGSLKLELLHRSKPKPRVGDVLTGPEVRETQWKRGTVLSNIMSTRTSAFILTADGDWVNQLGQHFSFIVFSHDPEFKYLRVVHLGEADV